MTSTQWHMRILKDYIIWYHVHDFASIHVNLLYGLKRYGRAAFHFSENTADECDVSAEPEAKRRKSQTNDLKNSEESLTDSACQKEKVEINDNVEDNSSSKEVIESEKEHEEDHSTKNTTTPVDSIVNESAEDDCAIEEHDDYGDKVVAEPKAEAEKSSNDKQVCIFLCLTTELYQVHSVFRLALYFI